MNDQLNNDKKDITGDGRFTFPKQGLCFMHKGNLVDLRAITEKRALQLAADKSCTFIELKAASERNSTNAASAASSSTSPPAKGDK